jgi:hypothetical protein
VALRGAARPLRLGLVKGANSLVIDALVSSARTCVLALSLPLALAVTGCGGSSGPTPSTTTTAASSAASGDEPPSSTTDPDAGATAP